MRDLTLQLPRVKGSKDNYFLRAMFGWMCNKIITGPNIPDIHKFAKFLFLKILKIYNRVL